MQAWELGSESRPAGDWHRDVLISEGEHWLFAHRRIGVDGFAGDSLMA